MEIREARGKNGALVCVFFLSAFLMGVSILGQFTQVGQFKDVAPRSWEAFDPELVRNTNTLDEILDSIRSNVADYDSMSAKRRMDHLFEVVAARFSHRSGSPSHNLFTNWILYSAGFVHPVLANVWSPETHMRKTHSLYCSQVSYILLALANKQDIPTRHINLHGHVVMEAWYENDWHMYDPDKEVIVVGEGGDILSVEEISTREDLLRTHYPLYKRGKVIDAFLTRENNSYVSYPSDAHFVWKASVLAWLERVLFERLKFVLPALLCLYCVWGLSHSKCSIEIKLSDIR